MPQRMRRKRQTRAQNIAYGNWESSENVRKKMRVALFLDSLTYSCTTPADCYATGANLFTNISSQTVNLSKIFWMIWNELPRQNSSKKRHDCFPAKNSVREKNQFVSSGLLRKFFQFSQILRHSLFSPEILVRKKQLKTKK